MPIVSLLVGFLYDNPLLKQELTKDHIEPWLLGRGVTTPNLSFIYVYLNRVKKGFIGHVVKETVDVVCIRSRPRNGHRKCRMRRYRRKQVGTASASFDMGVTNGIERSRLVADITDLTPDLGARAADATQAISRQTRRARAAHRATTTACPKFRTGRWG